MSEQKPTAAEKRHAAIRTLVHTFITPEGLLNTAANVQAVNDAIEALRPLGRTDRWQKCITAWQTMHEIGDLHWVILQGSVYATHAAE
jgi:hypothetical protein